MPERGMLMVFEIGRGTAIRMEAWMEKGNGKELSSDRIDSTSGISLHPLLFSCLLTPSSSLLTLSSSHSILLSSYSILLSSLLSILPSFLLSTPRSIIWNLITFSQEQCSLKYVQEVTILLYFHSS